MSSNMGGTEIYEPLDHAINKFLKDRPMMEQVKGAFKCIAAKAKRRAQESVLKQ